MGWSSSIQERIKRRLVAKVYIDSVTDYISRRFSVPIGGMSIVFEPVIAGTVRPDLVIVYNGTWFIVEFKTRPNLVQDLGVVMRYKRAVDEYVKPQRSIPILAYVYTAPSQSVPAIARGLKPLVVLHLARGTYMVLYESL